MKILTSLIIIFFFSHLTILYGHTEKILFLIACFALIIDREWIKIHWSKTHLYIILFLIIAIFSSLFTIDYNYFFQDFRYLFNGILLFLLIVELIILSFKKDKNVHLIFLNTVIVGGIILSFSLIFFTIKYQDFLLVSSVRPTGFTGNPNVSAFMLNISLALAIFLFNNKNKKLIKLFYIISVIILIIGIVITLSRAGIITTFFIFLIFLYKNRKIKKLWILISIILLIFLIFFGSSVISRISTLSKVGTSQDFSLYARLKFIKIGFINILHSPLFGIGFGDYIRSTEHYYSVGGIQFQVAHNTWIHVASETGLIGLFIYINIFYSIWKILKKAKKHAKKEQNLKNYNIAQALQISLLSMLIPMTFMSAQTKFVVFVFWGICIGSAYCILNNGGKIERNTRD